MAGWKEKKQAYNENRFLQVLFYLYQRFKQYPLLFIYAISEHSNPNQTQKVDGETASYEK